MFLPLFINETPHSKLRKTWRVKVGPRCGVKGRHTCTLEGEGMNGSRRAADAKEARQHPPFWTLIWYLMIPSHNSWPNPTQNTTRTRYEKSDTNPTRTRNGSKSGWHEDDTKKKNRVGSGLTRQPDFDPILFF